MDLLTYLLIYFIWLISCSRQCIHEILSFLMRLFSKSRIYFSSRFFAVHGFDTRIAAGQTKSFITAKAKLDLTRLRDNRLRLIIARVNRCAAVVLDSL